VWALPGDDGTVTIGTAYLGDEPADPAERLRAAVAALTDADPRFAAIHPAGMVFSGSLSTGFSPRRIDEAGVIVVGEAAGLANPFTGEGFSYAVQSAILAVHAIAGRRADQLAATRRYVRRTATTFVGYFETARHARRRYHLAWRILAAGAESDHPFFAKGRRAVLLPEGFSGLTAAERLDLGKAEAARYAPFLAACDEVAITVVRKEWPFLARLAVSGDSMGHHRLRPAIPFFAALLAAGTTPPASRAPLGAAIELALLSTLALLGPAPSSRPARGVDWALTSAILAGDFLLAEASRLVAEWAPEVSWSFADWLAELAALRAARLDQRSGVPAAAVYSALLEFPVRIGGYLGGCDPRAVRALREYGRQCGQIFLCAEDVLALRGEPTRLDTTLRVMLEGRLTAIPDYLGDEPVEAMEILGDAKLRSRALGAATATGTAALDRAIAVVAELPEASAIRILTGFAETAAAPLRSFQARGARSITLPLGTASSRTL
jgi:menaquinone-9 beta-reductase